MKNDLQLREDVMEEVKWDPLLSAVASQIGVASKDGVITLSGKVDTYIQKHAAEAAAQRVDGVSFVAVDLEVTLGVKNRLDDTAIAEAIRAALGHLSNVNSESVDVKVDDGVVTLDGTLKWHYQRQAVEDYIKNVNGVRHVNNNIQLSDEPCDARSVREQISAAFHRNATLDATNIGVDIRGQRVVLTGRVRSWVEKKDAENVAWSSPGIKAVENNIVVESPYVD